MEELPTPTGPIYSQLQFIHHTESARHAQQPPLLPRRNAALSAPPLTASPPPPPPPTAAENPYSEAQPWYNVHQPHPHAPSQETNIDYPLPESEEDTSRVDPLGMSASSPGAVDGSNQGEGEALGAQAHTECTERLQLEGTVETVDGSSGELHRSAREPMEQLWLAHGQHQQLGDGQEEEEEEDPVVQQQCSSLQQEVDPLWYCRNSVGETDSFLNCDNSHQIVPPSTSTPWAGGEDSSTIPPGVSYSSAGCLESRRGYNSGSSVGRPGLRLSSLEGLSKPRPTSGALPAPLPPGTPTLSPRRPPDGKTAAPSASPHHMQRCSCSSLPPPTGPSNHFSILLPR